MILLKTLSSFILALSLKCYYIMGSNLRVTTLNCYGIKTSLSTVVDLCNKSDIVFLQETLLFPHELCILSNVHPEFEGMGLSAIDTASGIVARCPYGGLAILIYIISP